MSLPILTAIDAARAARVRRRVTAMESQGRVRFGSTQRAGALYGATWGAATTALLAYASGIPFSPAMAAAVTVAGALQGAFIMSGTTRLTRAPLAALMIGALMAAHVPTARAADPLSSIINGTIAARSDDRAEPI